MMVESVTASEIQDRTQRRAVRTRQRLLEAALAMVSEKGVEATTIERITERADVGKGTFYRHFASKDEVVVALVDKAVDHLVDLLAKPRQSPQNLEQALEHLLQVHARFLIESTDEFALLFQGRMLAALKKESAVAPPEPFERYLEAIERHVAPHLCQPVSVLKVRRLSCALAEFVLGLFSFSTIGAGGQDVEANLAPLRRAFVAALATFLRREPAVPQA
jgi:AcrR family transcriptional regulator